MKVLNQTTGDVHLVLQLGLIFLTADDMLAVLDEIMEKSEFWNVVKQLHHRNACRREVLEKRNAAPATPSQHPPPPPPPQPPPPPPPPPQPPPPPPHAAPAPPPPPPVPPPLLRLSAGLSLLEPPPHPPALAPPPPPPENVLVLQPLLRLPAVFLQQHMSKQQQMAIIATATQTAPMSVLVGLNFLGDHPYIGNFLVCFIYFLQTRH
uniref:Uncharacterized protein n=1 Tax=Kalanchoe fedtschenkoi TaxID=63787 RepID=A0A7N1A8Y3_KALFE